MRAGQDSPSRGGTPSRVAAVLVALASIAVLAAALARYEARDYRPVFSRAAGTLVAVEDSTDVGVAADGKLLTDVTLVSDTGLEVRVRVRAPAGRSGDRHPAALLVGGFRTGRRTVEVPRESGDLVLASIEYPYDGQRSFSRTGFLRAIPDLRRSLLTTPPALLLAAQYLYARDDVDPERVTVVGVSLGAPFAAVAAATDRRLAGAALLHGGADIRRLVAHAYADEGPAWLIVPGSLVIAWLLAPLEPAKYAGEIAPRPVLLVNATDDEYIHPASARRLQAAARQPKTVVWIASPHVDARAEAIVDDLMRMTLDWMADRGLRGPGI